ncbi:MAG: hypothetical protein QOD13_2545, partial [Thermoleophilaceae bacterium]|nr:hypothetical protein [Thermoleophilaceae bacterium]
MWRRADQARRGARGDADLGVTDAVEIHARVLELRSALAAERIPLEVRCGGELG